ncbi:hypothetical protein ITI46_24795 [Streptomyces oryzae]|uniref:DUF3558 domain-containing protein n=1 Tax=Streptomyces oryzae TaxID=1434886 RepID=A0ABS3XHG8_9ACTN|nr:hypothetical protein [Streptomyces oryzae]MBO8194850.1 hypothetical protein [Streptomyces oryzae]
MPRRAKRYAKRGALASYATNAALALALTGALTGALTACTGSAGADKDQDGKPDGSSASPSAPAPGKYDSLPEPCGTVSTGQLRDMLPGAAAAEDDDSAAPSASAGPFEGESSVTYDTDRRVGCRWKDATTLSTRHLSVDFERVVSYDPAVSDDEQAERLYDKKARKAGIAVSPGGSASGQSAGETPDGHASPTEKKGDSDDRDSSGDPGDGTDDTGDAGDSTSPTPDEDLAPRALDDIGDAAYIDDELHTADSGLHRDITLVFRTANVIATVEYDQWVTDKHRIPDSHELQEKARELAEQLTGRFEED